MSQLLIQRFLNELSDLRRVSGTHREQVVREAFKDLLKDWGRSKDLIFIPEYEYTTLAKERRYVDGALLHELRVPFGYWEAKDEKDDLDAEIEIKRRRGYPDDNILYEDSRTVVLRQNKQEVMRSAVDDVDRLEHLLDLFFGYERAEIAEFRAAVRQFKIDLPAVLEALRAMIAKEHESDATFRAAEEKFLVHAKETINPTLREADIREMLIQHILTEEIFARVFDNADFHRQNNVARELYALEGVFFKGDVKFRTMRALEPYYAAIRSAAALVSSHQEKQAFLKAIYENFYKVYNPKAADRLGVVYTPNEIVRFMIEGADWLCQKHFKKRLIDRDVEILDPAAGTGTFITEMLEYFRGQPDKLRQKYKEELHANEVAILPYYVANLNIEATYAAITGQYAEYENLCFVDTLDNVAGLGIYAGHQHDMFGAMSEENIERIKRQNLRKISIIIGNPPYNAWQENYNSRNPNRPYRRVDERIRSTYAAQGTAQNQNSLYDMYVRFFRWASDRISKDGIIAFVSNRSFVDRLSSDGFRRSLVADFANIYVIDLGGDIRELSGRDDIFLNEEHTIFGQAAAVGIAISFLVKRQNGGPSEVNYIHPCDIRATRAEKFGYLQTHPIGTIAFERIIPDSKANWVNHPEHNWDGLPPIVQKGVKKRGADRAIFDLVTNGLKSQRDEWVYDSSRAQLELKAKYLVSAYERARLDPQHPARDEIKWDRELARYRDNQIAKTFDVTAMLRAAYRPFVARWLYFDQHFNGMTYRLPAVFPSGVSNPSIVFTDPFAQKPWMVLATSRLPDLHFVGAAAAATCTARYRYSKDGIRLDNVTDAAVEQFQGQYKNQKSTKGAITKDAIFYYVYAVLHDPLYREKYALNLKREFPRIPFYADFWCWAEWGEQLMALHIGYERSGSGRSHVSTRPTRSRARPGFRARRC
jgi:predicted helicase